MWRAQERNIFLANTSIRYVNRNAGLVIIRESGMTVFLDGVAPPHFVDSSRSAICHGNSTRGIGAGISIPRTLWSAVPPGVFRSLVPAWSFPVYLFVSRSLLRVHMCAQLRGPGAPSLQGADQI